MKQEIINTYISSKYKIQTEGNITSFVVPIEEILSVCQELYFNQKLQLKIITTIDEKKTGGFFRICYLFGLPQENIFFMPYILIRDKEEFPSITKQIHEASGYERRIFSFFGLTPIGHPSLRGVLLQENWPAAKPPLRKDFNWQERPTEAKGKYKFHKVKGEGIYEIPVGPVHAGIIEPGHFRFSVVGEEIVLLEPKLGYKHKGIEKLFEVLPLEKKLLLSERVSGDTSFSHSLAFCQAVENLAEIKVSEKVKYLRVIYSELERLANHFNDIGFILSDAGFSFGGSNGMRLKEKIMQWNEKLTGSRFLRGVNVFGGINKDISLEIRQELAKDLKEIRHDFQEVIEISEESSSVLNRLQGTGILNYQAAVDHGVLGVVGRAVGIEHDARSDYLYAAYSRLDFKMASEKEGDVNARLKIRIKEAYSSIDLIEQSLKDIPSEGELKSDKEILLKKNSWAIGITEGWRGEVVYFVATDEDGNISRVDVRDASFLNWTVLSYAVQGNIIPDFPLINKSFNLSYSGNDL